MSTDITLDNDDLAAPVEAIDNLLTAARADAAQANKAAAAAQAELAEVQANEATEAAMLQTETTKEQADETELATDQQVIAQQAAEIQRLENPVTLQFGTYASPKTSATAENPAQRQVAWAAQQQAFGPFGTARCYEEENNLPALWAKSNAALLTDPLPLEIVQSYEPKINPTAADDAAEEAWIATWPQSVKRVTVWHEPSNKKKPTANPAVYAPRLWHSYDLIKGMRPDILVGPCEMTWIAAGLSGTPAGQDAWLQAVHDYRPGTKPDLSAYDGYCGPAGGYSAKKFPEGAAIFEPVRKVAEKLWPGIEHDIFEVGVTTACPDRAGWWQRFWAYAQPLYGRILYFEEDDSTKHPTDVWLIRPDPAMVAAVKASISA